MSAAINEVDFTSQVAGWINQLISNNNPGFPIRQARIEGRTDGSLRRRDLTLYDQKGLPCITGEVKLPWAADGYSPYIEDVVIDAREKASKAGVGWFFTWNVNELLLWRCDDVGSLGTARRMERFAIASVHRAADLENVRILDGIRDEVERFVILFAQTLQGKRDVDRRAPDTYFIHSLESFLERPIILTKLELDGRFERPRERSSLEGWMRDRQGWSLGSDQEELLLRTAKFTNYTVANRLIFYEALRKRFSRLPELVVPAHITNAENLFEHFRAFFDTARDATGDYETVFGIDPNDLGDRVPFYEDAVVDSWRRLVQHVHRFDFSRLEYDVVGQIFETLIGPEERHKYGQYYTRTEVVDLINSFCIRDGDDKVLDPGCGGGTFLVRAYARKKNLAPRLGHLNLIQSLYGIDISRFATHLSTINLAARDLVENQNYPRVIRSDFFDIRPSLPFTKLPGADGKLTTVNVPRFDAIVGNPPYVRQEDIAPEAKAVYRRLVKTEAKLEANGRSDLHVYFWGHSLDFLKEQGWLGFLTSSQWLDVEYGFPLQHFLLERFKIIAIIESRIEPWFVGARVQTAVTIAQLESDEAKRLDNIVRFVEVRAPLSEIFASDGTSAGAIASADKFRDLVLTTSKDVTTSNFRIRCIPQKELADEGIKNGIILRGEPTYAGVKWGIPLRAPDLWKEIIELGGDRWTPLGELAEIRFGIKTGADKFFYVDDVTSDALKKNADLVELGTGRQLPRTALENGQVKIIENGYGERWPIESDYLQPVVHSLMHIDRYEVRRENCEHLILTLSTPIDRLGNAHVAAYIRRGEELGIPKGSTVAARANARAWYDLTTAKSGGLLWAKSHQYRHCAPLNPSRFAANCNLYTVETNEDPIVAAAVLNSTVVLLAKQLYGRPVGVESNLKTEIVDLNMMPVPDWTKADDALRTRLASAMSQLLKRGVIGILSERRLRKNALLQKGDIGALDDLNDATEFQQEDRQELDDVVLQLLGINDRQKRVEIRQRLYKHLEEYYEASRRKEEQAIANKTVAKRQAKLTPQSLAMDVFSAIERDYPTLLKSYKDIARVSASNEVEGVRIPGHGNPEIVNDLLTIGVRYNSGRGRSELIRTRSVTQAQLAVKLMELGEGGRSHFLPIDDAVIKIQLRAIDNLLASRKARLAELIEARTSDAELARKAFEIALARF